VIASVCVFVISDSGIAAHIKMRQRKNAASIHALTRVARLCAGHYCANHETAPQTLARGIAPRGQCASACVCMCVHVCVCACVRVCVCVCVWGGGGRNPAHLWVTVCVYAGSGEDGDADGIRAHKHRLQKGDNNVFARFCQDSTTISPPCS